MLYLLLAILSSAAISIFMRVSTGRISGNLSMLAVNYTVCLLLSAVGSGMRTLSPAAPGFSAAAGLGAVTGILYLASFMLLQRSIRLHGVVLSSIFMKLGLLVPMVASVFLFGEIPTLPQIVGFCVALGAIVAINFEKGAVSGGLKPGLILLLLLGGGGDAMAKVFEHQGFPALADLFLLSTFAVALVLCLLLVLRAKERPGAAELFFGAIIGVPNFFSAKFLLLALEDLAAVIVYPTYSVATLLVVTLAGVLFFRERPAKRQWLALCAIIPALILLNI